MLIKIRINAELVLISLNIQIYRYIEIYRDVYIYIRICIYWLVVWNIFYVSICWEEYSQLTISYFSEG